MTKTDSISLAMKPNKNHLHSMSYHQILVEKNLIINESLLNWFKSVESNRKIPWRNQLDPYTLTKIERNQRGYEIWISEIMSQQTQIATVIPYWQRWMKAFPNVEALAKADLDDVNAIWKGLGYYSRAKRLLTGAQTVMKEFDGILPITGKELEKIDGIGPYSAGAISSIAFGQRAPVVDGNVTRVFSRLTALHAPCTAKATTNFIWELADQLVPSPQAKLKSGGLNKPGSWNQALMELGATVCTPKNPKCSECPLSSNCLAYAETRALRKATSFFAPASSSTASTPIPDIEECTLCTPFTVSKVEHQVTQYPMAKEKKKVREEETSVCVVEWRSSSTESKQKGSKFLLMKRPESGLLAGLLEFPSVDLAPPPAKDSTPSSRLKLLHPLLCSLLISDLPPSLSISVTSSISTTSSSSPKKLDLATIGIVSEPRDLGAILQIYSHQKRVYHILHLVLTSSSLSPPSLALSSSSRTETSSASSSKGKGKTKAKEQELYESIVGQGEWIDASLVRDTNLGGAMMKVWDVVVAGKRAVVKEKTKAKVVSVRGGAQSGNRSASAAPKGKGKKRANTRNGYETEGSEDEAGVDEESESEIEIVEEVKVVARVQVTNHNATSPVKKKRKIIIADDSDDE